MLSGLFAGLAGVLYAIQNRFAAPDFVFVLVPGETVSPAVALASRLPGPTLAPRMRLWFSWRLRRWRQDTTRRRPGQE